MLKLKPNGKYVLSKYTKQYAVFAYDRHCNIVGLCHDTNIGTFVNRKFTWHYTMVHFWSKDQLNQYFLRSVVDTKYMFILNLNKNHDDIKIRDKNELVTHIDNGNWKFTAKHNGQWIDRMDHESICEHVIKLKDARMLMESTYNVRK
jgi:hypothetical protein